MVITWLADDVVVVDGGGRGEGGLGLVLNHAQPSQLDGFLEVLKVYKMYEDLNDNILEWCKKYIDIYNP